MKKTLAFLAGLFLIFFCFGAAAEWNNYSHYASVTATLNQRLATRTGPGTQYDEPGSFLSAGKAVTVLSKAYDSRNGIWWVQVEFSSGGNRYRAYTGVKRFRNLNLSRIPEESVMGSCRINSPTECFYGPSYSFREISRKVPAGVYCTIYGYEPSESSDFIQIEFYDSGIGKTRRAWIADWNADDYYLYGGF